jgi:polar amino acid transport system permease protein
MKYLISRAATALLFLWITVGSCLGAADYDQLFRQSSDLMAQGDLEGALHLLQTVPVPKAGEDAGAYVSSRMQMARIHASQDETDKALADCREVLKLFPDNSEARNFVAALEKQAKPRWHTILSDTIRFLPALIKGPA